MQEHKKRREATMIATMITVQGLRSFIGVALVGLGLDAAACRLEMFFWFLVREVLSLLFWGVLAGSKAQLMTQAFPHLGCPVQLLAVLAPLLRALAEVV